MVRHKALAFTIPVVVLGIPGGAHAAQPEDIAWYRFEPDTASNPRFLRDSSGKGNHLYTGNPSSWTPAQLSSAPDFSGSTGSAAFDGLDDVVRTVNQLDLRSFKRVRVNWWMSPQNSPGATGIVLEHSGNFNSAVGGFMAAVQNAPSGGLTGAAGLRTPGGYNLDAFQDGPLSPWQMMDLIVDTAAGRRDDVVRLSVDGSITPSVSYADFIAGDLPSLRNDWFVIGGRGGDLSTFFKGNIDELRVSSDTRLLGWWRFEPGTNFLRDSSGNGNHLVVSSGNAPTSTSQWYEATGAGAAYFSGNTILRTTKALSLTGATRVRISAWIRVDGDQTAVVWEDGTTFLNNPGSFTLTVNETIRENGDRTGLTGLWGASTPALDSFPHAKGGWSYRVVEIDLKAASPQIVGMWVDGHKEQEIRSEDSYVAASTAFLNDALTIGGRAQGGSFRFTGAIDELKIEAISDSRPPAVMPTRLYILAGQSNALGQAHTPVENAAFCAPQPGAWIWNQGSWYSVQPGFGWLDDRFGPEVSFAQTIRENTAEPMAIVKFAVGATSLCDVWAAPSGVHYQDLKRVINLAKASIPGVELAGIMWMQGENDGILGGSAAENYQTNLTNFINQLRSDLGNPSLRFVIGQIHPNWDPTGLVRSAQAAVAQELTNVKLVDTKDLSIYQGGEDSDHFDDVGMPELGRQFAIKMLEP